MSIMTEPDPDPRAAYAARTAALVDDFRANGGKVSSGPFVGRDLLLLTTIGARTGLPRLAPLVYDRDGDRLVVVGSKRGAPTHPAWYLNLLANPIVTLEVGAERFQARAVEWAAADLAAVGSEVVHESGRPRGVSGSGVWIGLGHD